MSGVRGDKNPPHEKPRFLVIWHPGAGTQNPRFVCPHLGAVVSGR